MKKSCILGALVTALAVIPLTAETVPDRKGAGVQSCVHCHQVGDALRKTHRERREPLPIQ